MSHYHHLNFSISPQPTVPTRLATTPIPLMQTGFNMLVEVATASAFVAQGQNSNTRKAIPVWAHFDTGASLTTIDSQLAAHLGLTPTGQSPISTANGVANTPNYAIDLSFINTPLRTVLNLQVSSCNLAHFNLASALQNPNNPKNFAILLGRDVMSLWNIVWNGPTSTVLISD